MTDTNGKIYPDILMTLWKSWIRIWHQALHFIRVFIHPLTSISQLAKYMLPVRIPGENPC
jgi:hypothetical protein